MVLGGLRFGSLGADYAQGSYGILEAHVHAL